MLSETGNSSTVASLAEPPGPTQWVWASRSYLNGANGSTVFFGSFFSSAALAWRVHSEPAAIPNDASDAAPNILRRLMPPCAPVLFGSSAISSSGERDFTSICHQPAVGSRRPRQPRAAPRSPLPAGFPMRQPDSALDRAQQAGYRERFRQVHRAAEFLFILGAVAGHENHPQAGVMAVCQRGQLEAVRFRHHNIRNQQLRLRVVENAQRLRASSRFLHGIARHFERSPDEMADTGFVVDDQNHTRQYIAFAVGCGVFC